MIPLHLIQTCAPLIAPVTMSAIVQTESGGKPWTIHDNTANQSMTFPTRTQAVAMARTLIAQGHQIDMGLAQVDSENLRWLGLTPASVFDPCTNLGAAQKILIGAYRKAGAAGPASLKAALEAYNSGNTRGDADYANTVYRMAGAPPPVVPAIPGGHLAPWTRSEISPGVPMTLGGPGRSVANISRTSWQGLSKQNTFGSGSTPKRQSMTTNPTAIWSPKVLKW